MNTPTPPNQQPTFPQIPIPSPEEVAKLRLQAGGRDQEEAVEGWLKKHLTTIFIAIILGLLTLLGWQWWQGQQQQQALLLAEQYSKFLQAESEGNEAVANTLAKNLSAENHIYGNLVTLQLAQQAANASEYAQAESLLTPLAADNQSPLQKIAQLRLAAIFSTQNQTAQALAQLNALPQEELPLVAEWRGDLFATLGQLNEARNAYVLALAQNGDSDRINFKIKQLTEKNKDVATPAPETPMIETPMIETPMIETPMIETPMIETPMIETPMIETPMIETPMREKPETAPSLTLP